MTESRDGGGATAVVASSQGSFEEYREPPQTVEELLQEQEQAYGEQGLSVEGTPRGGAQEFGKPKPGGVGVEQHTRISRLSPTSVLRALLGKGGGHRQQQSRARIIDELHSPTESDMQEVVSNTDESNPEVCHPTVAPFDAPRRGKAAQIRPRPTMTDTDTAAAAAAAEVASEKQWGEPYVHFGAEGTSASGGGSSAAPLEEDSDTPLQFKNLYYNEDSTLGGDDYPQSESCQGDSIQDGKRVATGGKDWRVALWSNLVLEALAEKEEAAAKSKMEEESKGGDGVYFDDDDASASGYYSHNNVHRTPGKGGLDGMMGGLDGGSSRGGGVRGVDVASGGGSGSGSGGSRSGGSDYGLRKHDAQRTVEDIKTVLDLIDVETAKLVDDTTLIMPVAPSDEDLVSYLDTKRFSFYIFAGAASTGVLGALWLFVLVSPVLYWLALPLLAMTLNQASTFVDMGVCTRDMTFKDHMEVVDANKDFLPSVDIYLPICSESLAILQNTWEHVCMLDWPNLNVWVLDDGAKAQHRELADMYGFHYLTRPDRPHLKKAGNLRFAFTQTKADFFVILDADFCPRQDFLRHSIPYFANEPDVGIVQTPQYFKVREGQTWVEQGAGIGQELFYRLLQQNRDRSNAAICVGSCGIYRRTAVAPFGGCSYVEHSEDIRIGMLLNNIGMRTRYLPLCLSMGVCPNTLPAFFMQQYRWAQGTLTLYDDDFWKSKLTFKQRIHFLTGLFWNTSNFSSIIILPLPSILLVILRPDLVFWWNIGFVLPALFFIQIYMRYYWISQRGKYGICVLKVKMIECYAHAFAFRDSVMGSVVGWEPTGAVKKVDMFDKSRRMITYWIVGVSLFTFGAVGWRVSQGYPFWHFIPVALLNGWEVYLHIDILSSQV